MRSILPLLLALFASSSWAQLPFPTEGPPGSISGTITATTGESLPGAGVLLIHPQLGDPTNKDEPKKLTAGPGGRYRFDDLEPGIYLLLVSHPGYVDSLSGSDGLPNGKGRAIVLPPGQHQDFDITLKPLASISGRVLDREGNGLEGFTVTAEYPTYVRGVRSTLAKTSVVTNDIGDYLMEDLAPGRYYIRARRPAPAYGQASPLRAIKPGERDLRLGNTFYPNADDVTSATAIVMEAGRTIDGIDIRMLEHEYFSVSGRIVGNDPDMATSHVLTSSAGRSGPAGSTTTIQADGSFILYGVPAGPASVVYWHQSASPGGSRTHGWTPIDVHENLDDVIIDIRVQGIAGSMRVDGESALDQLAEGALTRAAVRLRAVDGNDNRSTVPGADGEFTLTEVPRGRYIVDVDNLYGSPYVKELRLTGRPILDSVLDLSGGFPDGVMEVVISTDGGAVNGYVRTKDGETPPFATVTLVPVSRKFGYSRLYPTGDSDPSGEFEVEGIPPGQYEVFAWERIESTAHWNEDFLRPFLTRGTVVVIEEGKTENLDLDIITEIEMNEALTRAGL